MPYDGSSTLLLSPPGTRPALDLAPWHEARPHLLANALSEARRVAPHLTDLADRWLPKMPRRPIASQNIRSVCRDPSSGPLLLDDAVTCPWVALNTETGINAIAWDVDHDDVMECRDELQALGCPIPDIMLDPWSGRAHAVLWLATPVRTTEDALPKPQKTASYAARLMAAALRGGVMPQTGLVKSPWGCVSALTGKRLIRGQRPSVLDRWEAYQAAQADGSDLMWVTIPGTGPAELLAVIGSLAPRYELDAAPARPRVQFRKNRGLPSGLGRNCEAFDLVRWWAYDTGTTSTEEIHAEADRLNASGIFATPLPAAEVKSISGSIGRFMRERYRPRHGQDARRGRDREEGAELAAEDRQALAGRRSAEANASGTDAALWAAVDRLAASKRVLTQAALAAEADVSLRTVKRRWHALDDRPRMVPNAALSGSAPFRAPPLPSTKESSSLADLARLAKEQAVYAARIAAVVRELEELAAMWSRPGAEPGMLPAIPADLAHLLRIRQAKAEAIKSLEDARRRFTARQLREEAADRLQEMTRRAADRRAGWRWFRTTHLVELDMEWDARASGADDGEQRQIRDARAAAFAGRWKQWKRAMQLAHPARRQARDIEIDIAAIPY